MLEEGPSIRRLGRRFTDLVEWNEYTGWLWTLNSRIGRGIMFPEVIISRKTPSGPIAFGSTGFV